MDNPTTGMNGSIAIYGRVGSRLEALWGSEGALAKNALDANTDCQHLLNTIKAISDKVQEFVDDFAPEPPPVHIDELIDEIQFILKETK